MAQHDQNVANDTGAAVRADINSALAALFTLSAGASAPTTTIAYMLWADTTDLLLKQRNAANTGWLVRGTLAETFVIARSSNTILGVADFAKTIKASSSFTQTLTAAATLGDGWLAYYRNDGSGVITLDPNGAETIDGAATLVLNPGESCVIFCDGSSFKTIGRASSYRPYARGYLFGGTLSNNGADATNDIDIAAGGRRDSTDAANIDWSALTKQLDAAWAVGTNAGMRDTGAISNDTWHIFAIRKDSDGTADILASLSATAPTMPSGYTYFRRIGSILRESAAIVAFSQDGDEFLRKATALDVSASAFGTNAVTRTLSVPTGIVVRAILSVKGTAASSSFDGRMYISSLDQNDEVAAARANAGGSNNTSSTDDAASQIVVRTNTSAQVRSRAAGGDSTLQIATIGWFDTRGRDN